MTSIRGDDGDGESSVKILHDSVKNPIKKAAVAILIRELKEA